MAATSPFSPVDNEAPLRWQRAMHLVPPDGPAVARRAVFVALVTWVPIAIWALVHGRFVGPAVGEPLLVHYGVQVRCLIAMPLLIVGETTLRRFAIWHFPQFVTGGIVDEATKPGFDAVLRAVSRWRDSTIPWVFVLGVAIGWTVADRAATHADGMSWAFDEVGALGFGGVWFAYVVRPIFIGLLLGWLWRIALLTILFVRIGRLNLSLVPSHPDRTGGLGFVKSLPAAFAPVSFALSATVSSRWAHEVVHHGQALQALKIPAATFVVVWSLLLLVPLVPLIPVLHATKRGALPLYAAMVAEQGRLVRRRWIDRMTKLDEPLLEPAGVGPIADAATMYDAVKSMRVLPLGKSSLLGIGLPVAVPMLVVAGLEIPIKNLLVGLLKTLV